MSRLRMKVLVVEDEPDLRVCTRDTLRLGGYAVAETDDGLDVLPLARREAVGLVLLDLRLPSLDGLDVLGALKADPALRSVPVIVLTAAADDAERAQALAGGAIDYLVKPVSADALLAAVERALRPTDPGTRS